MTEVINNGGPAFPIVGQLYDVHEVGITMRDYFAARVMQGLISDANSVSEDTGKKLSIPHDAELIANASYAMSDAMLKAREMK